MLWRCTTETSWRRSTETSLGVSFKTYLQRRWDLLRDVVTTSCYQVGKIFERLRKNQITSFDNLLLLYHYSYRKEFLEDLESFIKKMEDHLRQYRCCGALLMELSKAFDKINHELLIAKIQIAFGAPKDILRIYFV